VISFVGWAMAVAAETRQTIPMHSVDTMFIFPPKIKKPQKNHFLQKEINGPSWLCQYKF
jgi:hypothetical protein